MKSILIIQTAFIGDVILATCLIEKLHNHFPQAKISFLLRKGNEDLLRNHPHLDEILIWNKKQQKFRNLWKIIRQVRRQKYDCVVNLQRFAATGLITSLSGAPCKIGFDKNPFSFLFTQSIKYVIGNGKHEIDRNLELISTFTDNKRILPKLYPSKRDDTSVRKYKEKPYVCIAPASLWFTKTFPVEQWVALIKQLNEKFVIYLIGGVADQAVTQKIMTAYHPGKMIDLAGKLSFLESAALMKDAHMNYVNDSAPLHIASAMNAPVTAVFCSTVPAFGFGPLSEKAYIWETSEKLPCRPCGLYGRKACPLGTFACAYTITVKA
ncbi:MAG: glycosyltransferase family 9 protein [Cytophagales bacterium]|nr:glycosyltransferase family 9 protein [Cytophagales bacterium]